MSKITNNNEEIIKDVKDVYDKTIKEMESKLNSVLNSLDTSNLTAEEAKQKAVEAQKFFFDSKMKDLGIDSKLGNQIYSNLQSGITPTSEIFNQLGVMIVEEEVRKVGYKYDFEDLLPLRFVENGIMRKLYQDYIDSDTVAGYSDVVIGDYNPDSMLAGEEVYQTHLDLHKGFAVYDSMLNDVTLSVAHFLAILVSYDKGVGQPIAKELYRYRLLRIADEFFDDKTYKNNGYKIDIDFTNIKPDFEFSGTNLEEAFIKLKGTIDSLGTISRNNVPSQNINNYKISGLTKNIEKSVNSEDLVILMSNELSSQIEISLKANAYNEKYLSKLPKIIPFDFEKSFSEYAGIKSLNKNMFWIVEKNFGETMLHYNGSKLINTPKLKQVFHTYYRYGFSKNKDKFKYLCLLDIKTTTP